MAKRNKFFTSAFVMALVLLMASMSFACTIVAVGKDATVDGSAIITHNDDSKTADFRLSIVPAQDWPEGAMRDIELDSHAYEPGIVMDKMPQVKHTYRYFKSRYSFMNEMGVAMGESTFGWWPHTDYQKKVMEFMIKQSDGIIDCWLAQDIALERAATAREAVRIMGDLVNKYGWNDMGETINITDGAEVWIAEFYGRDVWCAVRMPDDMFFVAANRARLRNIDLTDEENVMFSPSLTKLAVNQGWIKEKDIDMKDFSPADIYAHDVNIYGTRREWRGIDIVSPSLKLKPDSTSFPLFVKPDKKLSVGDIFKLKGDYYQGTKYDLSQGMAAGPWECPLRDRCPTDNDGKSYRWERGINKKCTTYVHIGQVKDGLPKPLKGISWFGYGAPASSYITPLWPAMKKLPEFYEVGSRYEDFRRDSGWWTNMYVQEMARRHWNDAINEINAVRDPKLKELYMEVPILQEQAAELYETDSDAAIDMITKYAYENAEDWHEKWLKLGDRLMGRYASGFVNFEICEYPEWWNEEILNAE